MVFHWQTEPVNGWQEFPLESGATECAVESRTESLDLHLSRKWWTSGITQVPRRMFPRRHSFRDFSCTCGAQSSLSSSSVGGSAEMPWESPILKRVTNSSLYAGTNRQLRCLTFRGSPSNNNRCDLRSSGCLPSRS